jgi:hypothetical protein
VAFLVCVPQRGKALALFLLRRLYRGGKSECSD